MALAPALSTIARHNRTFFRHTYAANLYHAQAFRADLEHFLRPHFDQSDVEAIIWAANEAFNNIPQHTNAQWITLTCRVKNGCCYCCLSDDGRDRPGDWLDRARVEYQARQRNNGHPHRLNGSQSLGVGVFVVDQTFEQVVAEPGQLKFVYRPKAVD